MDESPREKERKLGDPSDVGGHGAEARTMLLSYICNKK